MAKADGITMGHDTEFFLARDGKIVPADRSIIPGTKKNPVSIGNFAHLQLDNVLGELTCAPAGGASQFMDDCSNSLWELQRFLEPKGYTAVFQSHHHFSEGDLMTPHARVAACEPDFASDLDDPMKPMNRGLFETLRTASGHIHIGCNRPLDATEVLQYVRGFDFAMAPLMLEAPDGFERRKLYGQAGRFRFKPYGFEYRTPDNWWFGAAADEQPYHIYSTARQIMSTPDHSDMWFDINHKHSDLCAAINAGNKGLVETIIADVGFYRVKVHGSIRNALVDGNPMSEYLENSASAHSFLFGDQPDEPEDELE